MSRQFTRSQIKKFLTQSSSSNYTEKKLLNEVSLPSSDDIKEIMIQYIRDNANEIAKKISLKAPYGTQTAVEMLAEQIINSQADELSNCFVDLINPFE